MTSISASDIQKPCTVFEFQNLTDKFNFEVCILMYIYDKIIGTEIIFIPCSVSGTCHNIFLKDRYAVKKGKEKIKKNRVFSHPDLMK